VLVNFSPLSNGPFTVGQADPFEPITAELVLQNKAPSNPGAIVLLETSMPPEDRVRKFQAYSPGALLLSGYTGTYKSAVILPLTPIMEIIKLSLFNADPETACHAQRQQIYASQLV
jgi:hypothetical protein